MKKERLLIVHRGFDKRSWGRIYYERDGAIDAFPEPERLKRVFARGRPAAPRLVLFLGLLVDRSLRTSYLKPHVSFSG